MLKKLFRKIEEFIFFKDLENWDCWSLVEVLKKILV
jgi:hypothetical protein